MKDWMEASARQWNSLRLTAKDRQWPPISGLTVAACASSVGLEWFSARSTDLIAEFLEMDGAALLRHPTFGRVKVARLIAIVSACLETEEDGIPGHAADIDTRSGLEGLAELNVPADLPIALVRLPVRIEHYCEQQHVETLGELLEAWETLGESYFRSLPNLGKKSVGELRDLWLAVSQANTASLRQWLPVAPCGRGLSLESGLIDIVATLDSKHRLMLERRLVDGQTLEEAAAALGVTRERTRQVEARLLGQLAILLDWFPDARDEMASRWMAGQPYMDLLALEGESVDLRLIEAAIERVFQDRPEGAARDLHLETQIQEWQDKLKQHPDLLVEGVDLEEFMKNEVPEERQEAFCLSLDGRGRIRLDHHSGRVVHTGPRLREVVKAILAREEDPIPLTWLHHLVTQTPTHYGVTREQIYRYRIQWKSDDPSFPRDKILWNM